jgi:hypothetical protein
MNAVAAEFFGSVARPRTLSRAGKLFITVMMLIILEGAMRKWVATASSLPLVLLRDLVALFLVFHAWRFGYLRRHQAIVLPMAIWSLAVLGWGLLQLTAGESSPVLLLIGLRFWLLYTWFAVAAAASMTESDFRIAVLFAVWTLVLMAPLAVLQHFSPVGAKINAQTEGGDEEGVFVAVTGVVRTTGTFTFTAGFTYFMGMMAPLVFGMLSAAKRTPRQYLFSIAVFMAFAVGTMVSGSRTAVVNAGAMFGLYLLGRLMFSKLRDKPAAAVAAVIAVLLVGVFAFFFREAIDVTQTRFAQASESEDFLSRVITNFVGESDSFGQIDWLGRGIGMGSNLATYVQFGSSNFFPIAESEGSRILLEGGLLGVAYIILKVAVIGIGLLRSLWISKLRNSPFPSLLWTSVLVAGFTWSSLGQLTANGMLGVVFAFALLILRHPRVEFFPDKRGLPK